MVELKNDNGAMSVRFEGEYSTIIAEFSLLMSEVVSELAGDKINENKLLNVLCKAVKIDLLLKRGMNIDDKTDA